MNRQFLALFLASTLPIGTALAASQNVLATDPVGFSADSLPGLADSVISIPLTRPVAYSGSVESVRGATITVAHSPGFSVNQFVHVSGSQPNTYYAFIKDGDKEGNYYTITGNDHASITVDAAGDLLDDIDAGTKLQIIPYWTLGTAFPPRDAFRSFTPSVDATSRGTDILFPDHSVSGTDTPPAATFFFYNNSWRILSGDLSSVSDDVIFAPDSHFIVRNHLALAGKITVAGQVVTSSLSIPLTTQSTARQDNYVGIQRPVAFSLTDAGLIQSGAFLESASPTERGDELLIRDDQADSGHVPGWCVYYYCRDAWRKVGAPPSDDFGSAKVFAPGKGFVIRKDSNPEGSLPWVNPSTY